MTYDEHEIQRIAREVAGRQRGINYDRAAPDVQDHYDDLVRFVLTSADPRAIVAEGNA